MYQHCLVFIFNVFGFSRLVLSAASEPILEIALIDQSDIELTDNSLSLLLNNEVCHPCPVSFFFFFRSEWDFILLIIRILFFSGSKFKRPPRIYLAGLQSSRTFVTLRRGPSLLS